MDDTDFYLAQAVDCDRAAGEAILANQREKLLTAKKAWLTLASRVEDMRRSRLTTLR